MKKLTIMVLALLLIPVLGFAQETNTQQNTQEEQTIKFAPKNARDPMLSKEEVAQIEKERRAQIEAKAAAEKEQAQIRACQKKAEKAKIAREKCLKDKPYLSIIEQIKIQGTFGDEVQINNDFKPVGSQIKVDDKGKKGNVKITKVTEKNVSFKYEGKNFSLPIAGSSAYVKKLKEQCPSVESTFICENDIRCEMTNLVSCYAVKLANKCGNSPRAAAL